MKKINLAISGCTGRMGQQLFKSSKKNKNFKLVALTENRLVNKRFNGIKPELNSDKAFKKTDVIVDFTVPNCTLEILKIASKLKKKVIIGTTGFTRSQENQILKYSKKISILRKKNKLDYESGDYAIPENWKNIFKEKIVFPSNMLSLGFKIKE